MVKRDGSWKTWTYEEVKSPFLYCSSLYPAMYPSQLRLAKRAHGQVYEVLYKVMAYGVFT